MLDSNTGGFTKAPPFTIEEYQLSYTAKYWGFYGSHYHLGIKCYVTGAVNTETGQTTTRHYNERTTTNAELAKYACQQAWEELKEGLRRAPTEEERAIDAQVLEAWEESARRSALLGRKSRLPS